MGKEEEFDGVLRAYSESLGNVWYLLVGFAIAAFGFAWGTGWVDVRKKGKEGETKAAETVEVSVEGKEENGAMKAEV